MRLIIAASRRFPVRMAVLPVLALALPLHAADVGEGAPNAGLTSEFIQAYYRNGFHLKVTEPTGTVRSWGGTGLIQEFFAAPPAADANGTVRYALVRATRTFISQEENPSIFQVHPEIFSYYNSLGANTVGFPAMDTQPCPAFDSESLCTYQVFTKNHALFSYRKALFTGQNYQVRNNFYLKWNSLGGLSGPGIPIEAETAVTSAVGSTGATMQAYRNGVVYTITSGSLNGRVFGVSGAIFVLYSSQNTHAGHLGLPVNDEYGTAGKRRQDFQGGSIEYTPGSAAELRLPVSTVSLGRYDGSGSVRINLGETLEVTAQIFAANGLPLADRPVTWSTSNSRVVTVQSTGNTATIRAVGGGNVVVTAASEGKTRTISIFVFAPCCQVGEGAPNAQVQQSFQDAVTRLRLSLALPSPFVVRRAGAGYIQEVTGTSGARYLIAKSDRISMAYIVSGELLAAYERAGGPAGALGHPISDASPGGTQSFENGALGGSPARTVTGIVLSKWNVLGQETGAAGPPIGDAAAFLSANSTSGTAQAFRLGVIYGLTSGGRRGQAYLVGGAVLGRYLTLSGPAGDLGAPQSDEFVSGGVARQLFENGSIRYTPGEPAVEEMNERRPAVTALPASVVAGSRVQLVISGFPAGSAIRVSVTGRPDFTISTRNGSHSWEAYVPLDAPAAVVTVRAADTAGAASAETAYTVRTLAQARLRLTKIHGDNQVGPPGSRLPAPLRVRVRDEDGNAVMGVPVTFRASPGAQVLTSTVPADQNGEAETAFRLPATPGIALATAEAAATVVTFSAQATGVSATNFPAQRQAGDAPLGNSRFTIAQKGALLTAASSVIRYFQNRGEMLAINGLAEPAVLNEYLKSYCAFDAAGNRICDGFLTNPDSGEPVVNLGRLSEFVTATLEMSVEQPESGAIAEFVGQGQPMLLALALTADGVPIGGHWVVATGVEQDGNLAIHDPNAALARTRLSEYLGGFAGPGGRLYQGSLTAAIRLFPRIAAARRFLLSLISLPADQAAASGLDVRSMAGVCGLPAEFHDAAVIGGDALFAPPRLTRFLYCDGAQTLYQAAVAGPAMAVLTDFANGGGARPLRAGSYTLSRPAVTLHVSPLETGISSLVNAAAPEKGIAVGSAVTASGAGLAGPGGEVQVLVGGTAARVISANAFQVSFEIPLSLAPGAHTLRVASVYGAVELPVEVLEVAPAIFLTSPGRGAVYNQNRTLNDALHPAPRGQAIVVHAAGLGALVESGNSLIPAIPVVAVLNGVELPVSFVGPATNLVGVYPVNVVLPTSTPPGLDLPLILRQGGAESNAVPLSVQ